MLENIALSVVGATDGERVSLWFGLIIAGFIVGIFIQRSAALSMRRVPYFIWLAVASVVTSTLPFGWLMTPETARGDSLWMLVLPIFGGAFAYGVFCGVLACARSVSAYGDGSQAWLGIVPVVNLILVFKRPLNWERAGFGRFTLNAFGVIFGLSLLSLSAALGKMATNQISNAMRQWAESSPLESQEAIGMLVNDRGLEQTLQLMAEHVPSRQIDSVTTLLRAEVDGTTLRYVYEVSANLAALPVSNRTRLFDSACSYEAFQPLINAGATIEYAYFSSDGANIGTVRVTRQSCRLAASNRVAP